MLRVLVRRNLKQALIGAETLVRQYCEQNAGKFDDIRVTAASVLQKDRDSIPDEKRRKLRMANSGHSRRKRKVFSSIYFFGQIA